MNQAQRMAIDSPVVGLMVYQTNSTPGFYYFTGADWSRIGEHTGHFVGESFGGGVVFWTNEKGDHGLICSMIDLSPSQPWSNITNVEIGEPAQSDWNGLENSQAIEGQNGHVSSAAQLCLDHINDNYGTGTFSDWHLPSIGEAIHLMNNFNEVQKALDSDGDPATTILVDGLYWTSTEEDASSAWVLYLAPNQTYGVKSTPFYVRAVRAF